MSSKRKKDVLCYGVHSLSSGHHDIRILKRQHAPNLFGYRVWASSWLLMDFLKRCTMPAGSHVTLELESRDYSYSFYVPDYDLIEVALPGPPYRREFDSGAAGVHRLLGSQMCGYAHPDLLGDVTVMQPDEFEAWILSGPNDRRPPASASDPAS